MRGVGLCFSHSVWVTGWYSHQSLFVITLCRRYIPSMWSTESLIRYLAHWRKFHRCLGEAYSTLAEAEWSMKLFWISHSSNTPRVMPLMEHYFNPLREWTTDVMQKFQRPHVGKQTLRQAHQLAWYTWPNVPKSILKWGQSWLFACRNGCSWEKWRRSCVLAKEIIWDGQKPHSGT